MLELDQWEAALSRVIGKVYRGTERISSNALLNLLEVGPDPIIRQRVAKRHNFGLGPGLALFFPELDPRRMQPRPQPCARACPLAPPRIDRECDTLQR
jgi:hypothetical protein